MDVLEAQVLIRAAPERVMPFLIDPELLPLWSPTEVLVKRLSRTLKRKGKGTEVHNRMEFDRPDMVTFLGWKAVGKVIAEADMREKMPLLKKSVESAERDSDG